MIGARLHFDKNDNPAVKHDQIDFAAAAALPVRGSSTLKAEGKALHWTPVDKSHDFRPLERASHWTARQNRLFRRKGGHLQQLLGYSLAGAEIGRASCRERV